MIQLCHIHLTDSKFKLFIVICTGITKNQSLARKILDLRLPSVMLIKYVCKGKRKKQRQIFSASHKQHCLPPDVTTV